MDQKSSKTEAPARQFGLARDLRRVKADSGEAAAELAEFMRQFRGKRPQEVLGLVAQSGLVRATGLATVATVVLIAALTVIPFAWGKAFPESAKRPAAPAAAESTPAAEQQPAGNDSATAATPAAGAADPNKPVESQEFTERMGIETVESDPGTNPLEESADDLLNDIK